MVVQSGGLRALGRVHLGWLLGEVAGGGRWGRSLCAAVRSVSYLCVSTRFAWGSQASRALSDGWASALVAVYRDYDVQLGALRLRLAGFMHGRIVDSRFNHRAPQGSGVSSLLCVWIHHSFSHGYHS